jgi:hypothetical protein
MVTIVLESSSELEPHAFEFKLLQSKYGKGTLINGRRERLRSRRGVVSVHSPKPEATGERPDALLIKHRSVHKLAVIEPSTHLFALNLLMLVLRIIEGKVELVEKGLLIPKARIETRIVTL